MPTIISAMTETEVDYRCANEVKLLHDIKYSVKGWRFSDFICNFAKSLSFLLALNRSTKVREKPNVAKS